MKEKINIFMEPIVEKKKKFHLNSYIKMRKLCKSLKKTSPDFNMLMDIYRFLRIIEQTYMYSSNDNKHHLNYIIKSLSPEELLFGQNPTTLIY